MICRFYTVYNNHEMIKIAIKAEKNSKYYQKCSNNNNRIRFIDVAFFYGKAPLGCGDSTQSSFRLNKLK